MMSASPLPDVNAPGTHTTFLEAPWMAPLTDKWEAAVPYEAYLPTATGENVGLWNGVWRKAAIEAKELARLALIPGEWRLLLLSEDWCGDAANTVPVISRLAELVTNLEVRLLARDENLDLMDAHLTGARSRSIPVAIVVDQAGHERAWWGPRPAVLQQWVVEQGLSLPSETRYPLVRRWYAQDRGRTTVAEIVAMLEQVALRSAY